MEFNLDLRTALLRTVAGHINATAPKSARSVLFALSQKGLAAESDGNFSSQDCQALGQGIDKLEKKVFALVDSKQDSEVVLGIPQLRWLITESSNSRFIHSFTVWGQKLIQLIKEKTVPGIQCGVCETIQSLFARLHGVLWLKGVKKNAAMVGSKVLQTLASKIKSQETELTSWRLYVSTIITVMKCMSSTSTHIEASLSPVILPKLIEENAIDDERLLASEFLGILVQGSKDNTQWSNVMRHLILTMHNVLGKMYGGYEDGAGYDAVMEELKVTEDCPTSASVVKYLNNVQLDVSSLKPLIKIFAGVLDSIERLLTIQPDSPLPIPSRHIVSVIPRIVSVEFATLASAFNTSPNTLELLSHLPSLHACAWNLLSVLTSVAGNQLMPINGSILRLLRDHLHGLHVRSKGGRTDSHPATRRALYEAARKVVEIEGIASAQVLGPDIVSCLRMELNTLLGKHPHTHHDSNTATPHRKKGTKRKKDAQMEANLLAADVEMAIAVQNGPGGEGRNSQYPSTALGTAECEAQTECVGLTSTLLGVGGAVLASNLRRDIDGLVGRVASVGGRHNNSTGFTLAVYSAIAASVLSPCGHRPRLLPMASRLFQEGKVHVDPAIREFCYGISDKLEALLHPRAATMHKPLPEEDQPGEEDADAFQFSALPTPLHFPQQTPVTLQQNRAPGTSSSKQQATADPLLMHDQPQNPHETSSKATISMNGNNTRSVQEDAVDHEPEEDISFGNMCSASPALQEQPVSSVQPGNGDHQGTSTMQTAFGSNQGFSFSLSAKPPKADVSMQTTQGEVHGATGQSGILSSGPADKCEQGQRDTGSGGSGGLSKGDCEGGDLDVEGDASDSEGPMPGIDSGGSDDGSGDEMEES